MKIGIAGVGNMGAAIARGLIKSEKIKNEDIFLYNRTESKLEKFKGSSVNICNTQEELIQNSEVIILGLKPPLYKPWLEQYKEQIKNKLFISIAAGITSEVLNVYTPLHVLTMPNMGSGISSGYTAICKNEFLPKELQEVVIEESSKIFSTIGKVKIIQEEEMEVYIGLIGSSPAYFINIVKHMSKYFTDLGYEQKQIEQTLAYIMGTASNIILNKQDESLEGLINSVCSKGGCTIEAITYMDNNNIEHILNESIDSCVQRAKIMKVEK